MARTEAAGLGAHRRALVARAQGSVLEIGGGTGANLRFYGPGVTELVLVEPEAPMARRLEQALAVTTLPGRIVRAGAERLPFPDDRFDFVVSTLVLCTVSDAERSLAEIRRVLRPGGRLLFLEHVRSEEPGLAAWQDRLHGLHKATACGCHCNRPTLEFIAGSGLVVQEVAHQRMPRTIPIVRPLIVGAASA